MTSRGKSSKRKKLSVKKLLDRAYQTQRSLAVIDEPEEGSPGKSVNSSGGDRNASSSAANLSTSNSSSPRKATNGHDIITTYVPTSRIHDAIRSTDENSELGLADDLSVRSRDSFMSNYSGLSIGSAVSMSSRSIGSRTYRAVNIESLDENGMLETRHRTIRELVEDIEYRSSHQLKTPSYVPQISEVLEHKFSWNKNQRMKKKKLRLGKDANIEKIRQSQSTPLLSQIDDHKAAVDPHQQGSESNEEMNVSPKKSKKSNSLQVMAPGKHHKNLNLMSMQDIAVLEKTKQEKAERDGSDVITLHQVNQDPMYKEYRLKAQNLLKPLPSCPKLPAVDLMGCLNPIEVILSRANRRSRHSVEVKHLRKLKEVKEHELIHEDIINRMSRNERYQIVQRHQLLQKCWLTIFTVCHFMRELQPKYLKVCHNVMLRFQHYKAMQVITRNILRWRKQRIFQKYSVQFKEALRVDLFFLIFRLRIVRKRRALTKIVYFINSLKEKQKITWVVHRFVTSVRRIQNYIRDFLACKKARIESLTILWNRLEHKYVKAVLKSRKDSKIISKSGKNNLSTLKIDEKTRIEMEKQNKRWNEIDTKMEESILKHRLLGNLTQETGDEAVTKHLLPEGKKYLAIEKILKLLRKEYFLKRQEAHKVRLAKRNEFSQEDALDLLKGNMDVINNVVREKFEYNDGYRRNNNNSNNNNKNKNDNSSSNNNNTCYGVMYEPFILYRQINSKFLIGKIREAHEINKTFAINIPNVSQKKMKMLKIAEQQNLIKQKKRLPATINNNDNNNNDNNNDFDNIHNNNAINPNNSNLAQGRGRPNPNPNTDQFLEDDFIDDYLDDEISMIQNRSEVTTNEIRGLKEAHGDIRPGVPGTGGGLMALGALRSRNNGKNQNNNNNSNNNKANMKTGNI